MKAAHDRIALAHAVFGSLAALVVIPAALLVGRLNRGKPQWWRTHAMLTVLGALLVILTFGLGLGSVAVGGEGQQLSGNEADVHHLLGLAIFLIVMLQVLIGATSHFFFRPRLTGTDGENAARKATATSSHWQSLSSTARTVRAAHISVGIVTAGLLYWITWNGMHTEWNSMAVNESKTPEWIQIVYWILVAIPLGVYSLHAGVVTLQSAEASQGSVKLQ